VTISQKFLFPIWNKDTWWATRILYWRNSLFLGALLLCLWSREGGKDSIALVRAMVMSIIVVLGVQIATFGERARLAIIIIYMMVVIAPAA
jgi:hypothetical protein